MHHLHWKALRKMSDPYKFAVIGDVHYDNGKFNKYISTVLESIPLLLKDEYVDHVVWLGDLLHTPILTTNNTEYLGEYFKQPFGKNKDLTHIVLGGNHDFDPVFEKFATNFLSLLTNVAVVTSPSVYKGILYVPHIYNGYDASTSDCSTIIAHLGILNITVNNSFIYSKKDVLTYGNNAKTVILGHIHTPLHVCRTLETDDLLHIYIPGNITPMTWGDSNDDRFIYIFEYFPETDETIMDKKIPLPIKKVVEIHSQEEADMYKGYIIRLVTSAIPAVRHPDIVDIKIEQPKGTSLLKHCVTDVDVPAYVQNICESKQVNYESVQSILKEVGVIC